MTKHIPLYDNTLKEATKYGEVQLWRESNLENCKCASAIEDGIAANFHDNHLDTDFARNIIEQFGFNRVNRVVANTIQTRPKDGRFSESNKSWAKTIHVPNEDSRRMYDLSSHPGLVDLFANQVRELYQELGLFDGSHCVEKPLGEDYTNKVLILKASVLKDEYKKPEFQLFFAESGFGCIPTALGTKVYGEFLYDGEKAQFNRYDFYGPIAEEFLPQWAKEKVAELTAPEVPGMVQTM